ncbi:MAG: exopolysaccharide biosynthesis polyprenyl glycosylphosphotransferase [Luteitalea sp.]|nr:exopolysaccharide biosynthesis polyprenyl glycosylphosphotransferase [Luteitalea sp.]
MTYRFRSALPLANRVFDALCAFLLLLAIFAVANLDHMPEGVEDFLSARVTVENVLLLVLFLVAWNTAFATAGLHTSPSRQPLWRQALLVVHASTVGTLPLSLFVLTSQTGAFRLSMVGAFWVAAMVVEVAGRTLITMIARDLSRRAAARVNVLIVGTGPRTRALFHGIRSRRFVQHQLLGFVDSPGDHEVPPEVRERIVGTLDDLEAILARNPVDLVLVSLPVRSCYAKIQQAISICERVGVEVQIDLSDFFSLSLARAMFEQGEEFPALRLTLVTEDYRTVIKRLFDVCAAAAGLVVLSPVMAVCALLIKLGDGGAVFFSQQRYGYNRRVFRMYKFRTMVVNAESLQASLESQNEAQGPVFKIRRDPRITPIGHLLRKTSLDELPQLFNVLKGDMSVVGPRPLPLRDVALFGEARLMRRFSVRPGLTCVWQVNGRSDTNFDTWVNMDLAYIDNWSLSLDARILLKTVPAVLSGAGAA